MLFKRNRLDRKTIDEIFKNGFFVNSSNLTLKYLKKKDLKEVRFSFVVPKTVSKKAVDRNLLKRRGYAILFKKLDKSPVGVCGVFLFGKKSKILFGGKKNKEFNPVDELEKEIDICLQKLK